MRRGLAEREVLGMLPKEGMRWVDTRRDLRGVRGAGMVLFW
jgi:hypothetical protein